MSKWEDLTDAQKERLVAVSRGEQSDVQDETYWNLVDDFGFIEGKVDSDGDKVEFITPAGGALLAERDKLLTDALEGLMRHFTYVNRPHSFNELERVEEFEYRTNNHCHIYDRESDLGSALFAARDALAAVAKERGE